MSGVGGPRGQGGQGVAVAVCRCGGEQGSKRGSEEECVLPCVSVFCEVVVVEGEACLKR